MWDFTKVIWRTSAAMRYDTPGDWHGNVIEAWAGMPPLSQQAVHLHEFNESAILRAAGITEEQIDIMDSFKNAAIAYAKCDYKAVEKIALLDKMAFCAQAYEAIPPELRNLYDEAHVIALMVERAFLEAAGGNWQEHCKMIEDTRGKIPVREA
jgi:hypothetical protein